MIRIIVKKTIWFHIKNILHPKINFLSNFGQLRMSILVKQPMVFATKSSHKNPWLLLEASATSIAA